MSQQRFNERKADAVNAAARLMALATAPGDDVIRDATIQRFEFTFEAVWKALKLYLDHQGLQANSPREVFRQAFAEKLIETEEEADEWIAMLEDRNLTSHVYREALAEEIYVSILASHAQRLNNMADKIGGLTWR
ncbi:MAG: nucleotidyltransferase substrate binding protein [Candidatus Hydrogenedentes bacterium]|nr:nucleotidyltransferase substrate binding protein [Candidatus Hydrogenedentota bacterium]